MGGKQKKAPRDLAVSKFKATGPAQGDEQSWIGSMRGTVKIVGDIISPVIETKKKSSGHSTASLPD